MTATQSWQDIPTCKSQGLDVEYLMLRGIFMPRGVTQEQVDFYVDLFKKVRALPEWKKFTEDAAFNDTFMSGKEYADWVAKAEDDAQASSCRKPASSPSRTMECQSMKRSDERRRPDPLGGAASSRC